MTSNKDRAMRGALAGMDEILSGQVVAPKRLPTAKATQERPMPKFGVDVRALLTGTDDDTALIEPVALSGNSKDNEIPVKSGLVKTDAYLAAYDPGTNTHSRVTLNHAIKVLDAAARTAATLSDAQLNRNCRGAHFILNVTAGAAVGNEITPTIQGFDPIFNVWYNILSGSAINAAGINVLKIYPGIAGGGGGGGGGGANVAADILPKIWRISVAHAGALPVTYSATANLVR